MQDSQSPTSSRKNGTLAVSSGLTNAFETGWRPRSRTSRRTPPHTGNWARFLVFAGVPCYRCLAVACRSGAVSATRSAAGPGPRAAARRSPCGALSFPLGGRAVYLHIFCILVHGYKYCPAPGCQRQRRAGIPTLTLWTKPYRPRYGRLSHPSDPFPAQAKYPAACASAEVPGLQTLAVRASPEAPGYQLP